MDAAEEFSKWLGTKLKEFQIEDEEVVEYVKPMVQLDDEDEDEARESIEEFLQEVTETPLGTVVADIFTQWHELKSNHDQKEAAEKQKRLEESEAAQAAILREPVEIPAATPKPVS